MTSEQTNVFVITKLRQDRKTYNRYIKEGGGGGETITNLINEYQQLKQHRLIRLGGGRGCKQIFKSFFLWIQKRSLSPLRLSSRWFIDSGCVSAQKSPCAKMLRHYKIIENICEQVLPHNCNFFINKTKYHTWFIQDACDGIVNLVPKCTIAWWRVHCICEFEISDNLYLQ